MEDLKTNSDKTGDSDLEEPSEEDVVSPEPESEQKQKPPLNMAPGAVKLRSWLNKTLKIKMTDGRILIGVFLCTDRDANIILGSCTEYLPEESDKKSPGCSHSSNSMEEPRMLGLVMVPGKHIVSIYIDQNESIENEDVMKQPLTPEINADVM